MDEFKSGIKKLNNGNYQVWKYKLELLLIKEDLWDIVINEKPENVDATWMSKDGKARATIGLLVDDSQLVHLRKLKTARDYWETLMKTHEKSTLSNKVMLLKKLCRMQLKEGQAK